MEKVKKEKFEMGKWLNDILFRCIIDGRNGKGQKRKI